MEVDIRSSTTGIKRKASTSLKRASKKQKTKEFKPKIIQVKSGVEKKVIDVAPAVYQVNTTGSLTLLNGCVRGTDIGDRVGRKILVKSIYIRGYCSSELSTTFTASTNAITQLLRMIVVYDNEANAGTPLITDILKTALSYSQLNIDNRDRFTVLADEQYVIGAVSTNSTPALLAGSEQGANVQRYIKCNHPVIYNSSNNGDYSDINTGSIWMVWIGNVAAGTGTDGNARVSTRVRFTDE